MRTKSAVRVAEFVSKFPLKSFLIQAPQVTADVWGVGIQIGSIMGVISDAMYGAVRAATGASVTIRGPLPSDPLTKAFNYMTQPSYHHGGGQAWSYEDHFLLLAADIIATRIIMSRVSPTLFEQRGVELLDYPVVHQEPWHPQTRAMLTEIGWTPAITPRSPFDDTTGAVTYRQTMQRLVDDYPTYLQEIRSDFPASSSATIYANMLAEITEELLTWGTGETTIGKDVFDPQEMALARSFETGIIPPADDTDGLVEQFTERATEIANARGRQFAQQGDLKTALAEVYGIGA